ncbi:uncharacterized protein G2W53_037150 [Senna tora]|uniref:Uncharacterized protein n=1 Tax=Senna tora TaxID=362788 RepID=A0A834SYQ0_9FABA|nr:uncharacterized protein G2W53_037150 [Senna tora]
MESISSAQSFGKASDPVTFTTSDNSATAATLIIGPHRPVRVNLVPTLLRLLPLEEAPPVIPVDQHLPKGFHPTAIPKSMGRILHIIPASLTPVTDSDKGFWECRSPLSVPHSPVKPLTNVISLPVQLKRLTTFGWSSVLLSISSIFASPTVFLTGLITIVTVGLSLLSLSTVTLGISRTSSSSLVFAFLILRRRRSLSSEERGLGFLELSCFNIF